MPKATGLQFFRKRQSLANLEFERPQNLQSVYEAVKNALIGVEDRLSMLELSFYGPEKTIEGEVKKWLPQIEAVIKPARYTELFSKKQIVFITERVHNASDKLMVDLHCLSAVHECIRKILTTLRVGFADMIIVFDKLMCYMNKYLLSFSPTIGDEYVETATNYENQRLELSEAIEINIKNITLLADKFENEELHINFFDYWLKTIAEKCDCMHASFLLAFPAACENIRNACSGVRKWLEADVSYIPYLNFDINALETRRDRKLKQVRELQVKVCNVDYRQKSLRREITDSEGELLRVTNKEKELEQEDSYLKVAQHDLIFDLEIKEFRMTDMKRNKVSTREYNEAFDRLQSEINTIREKKPVIDRKLSDIDKKMSWMHEKQDKARERDSQTEQIKLEYRDARRVARKAEVELERVGVCLTKLKDIHRVKTSAETLKKIFHRLPFTPRKLNNGRKLDTLDRACRIASQWIEGDWLRLYRVLPFYPARGEEIIGVDIDNIAQTHMRHSMEEQAKQALALWRRMHTRDKIDDLTDALLRIRRKDIVNKIELSLASRKKLPPVIELITVRTVRFPKLSVKAS